MVVGFWQRVKIIPDTVVRVKGERPCNVLEHILPSVWTPGAEDGGLGSFGAEPPSQGLRSSADWSRALAEGLLTLL